MIYTYFKSIRHGHPILPNRTLTPKPKKPVIARLILPLLALLLLGIGRSLLSETALTFGIAEGSALYRHSNLILATLCWMFGALLIIRLIHITIWEGVVKHRIGMEMPSLLTDLVDGVIWIITIVVIIAVVFERQISGIITTSSVAMAVLGFALKTIISDLFSGVALTLERTFNIGDWVETSGGIVGKIQSLSWRSTQLLLENGTTIIISNSRISEMQLKKYERWRDEIDIEFGYEVTTHQVERILLTAAHAIPEVTEKKPDVRIVEFGPSGVKWRLRYWIDDYPSRSKARYTIQRNLLRNLHFAGIETPAPRLRAELIKGSEPSRLGSVKALMGRIDLFYTLTDTELAELAENVKGHLIRAGSAVVQQGDDGASLYLIKEGLFDVIIADKIVGQLGPGAFFGEMSLLTGAPRSATVMALVDSMVYEVSKDIMEPIIAGRHELVEDLGHKLAERQIKNAKALEANDDDENTDIESTKSLTDRMLNLVRSYFSLKSS